ncbi:MAG: PDDEXK nuclease domain-containing protein [Paludibacteraceae bacterium]|nr:PDDEXK nuclease domain-containing protein [Paludibacteraceae bacterium]
MEKKKLIFDMENIIVKSTTTPSAETSIEIQHILNGLRQLIETTKQQVLIYVNQQVSMQYYAVGKYIVENLHTDAYSDYGKQILATVSQTLQREYGSGYSYSALTRMVNVSKRFDKEKFVTLSQTLSWSHFLELATIEDDTKRLFYEKVTTAKHWSVRALRDNINKMYYERTLIAAQPQDKIIETLENTPIENNVDVQLKSSYILDFLGLTGYYSEEELEDAILVNLERFLLELGEGFTFEARQKRFTIDSIDYKLDLLFFHRKLNRLVAIDLKLGKFLPEYKGQMELYLKYLQRNEMEEHENPPIGLILCSEGNTEHVELMMLGEDNIKVAQYVTQLPDKQWFIDKLNRSIAIAQANKK